MAKPVSEWKEDDVLSLPIGENDTFERKGARLLDLTIVNVNEGDVLDQLGKQLSAFANTGGGQIIYGLTNAGLVDNRGIARTIKGKQSTKEWLEDVIPTVTDFEVVGFNVFEVQPNTNGSAIAPDKSIFVVDVPDSDRAPHQSKRDHKYYVRLGGKSRPASHRLIEDIRNRARHPRLEVHDLRIISAVPGGRRQDATGLVSEFQLSTSIGFGVRNNGTVRAANTCLQLSSTVPLSRASINTDECFLRHGASGTALLELRNPLYPGMGVVLGCLINVAAVVKVLPQGSALAIGGLNLSDVLLSIAIFADSAPAHKQEFRLSEIDPEKCLERLVLEEVRHIRSSEGRFGRARPTGTPWS